MLFEETAFVSWSCAGDMPVCSFIQLRVMDAGFDDRDIEAKPRLGRRAGRACPRAASCSRWRGSNRSGGGLRLLAWPMGRLADGAAVDVRPEDLKMLAENELGGSVPKASPRGPEGHCGGCFGVPLSLCCRCQLPARRSLGTGRDIQSGKPRSRMLLPRPAGAVKLVFQLPMVRRVTIEAFLAVQHVEPERRIATFHLNLFLCPEKGDAL